MLIYRIVSYRGNISETVQQRRCYLLITNDLLL